MDQCENDRDIKSPGINSSAVYCVHFSRLYCHELESHALVKSKTPYVQLCVLLFTDIYIYIYISLISVKSGMKI